MKHNTKVNDIFLFIAAFFLLLIVFDNYIDAVPLHTTDARSSNLTLISSDNNCIVCEYKFSEGLREEEFLLAVPPDCKIVPTIIDGSFTFKDKKADNKETNASSFIDISEAGYIRFNRIIKLKFKSPSLAENVAAKNIKVKLGFDKPISQSGFNDPSLLKSTFGFGKIIRNIVVNPNDVINYASNKVPGYDTKDTLSRWLPQYSNDKKTQWLKLKIDKEGYYKIDAQLLQKNGVDLAAVTPDSIKIYNKGIEVPTYIVGEPDKSFSQQNFIIFYVPNPRNDYSKYSVYWTYLGGEKGSTPTKHLSVIDELSKVNTIKNSPASFIYTTRIEKDEELIRTGDILSESRPIWAWHGFLEKAPAPFQTSFDLPFLITSSSQKTHFEIVFAIDKQDRFKKAAVTIKINDLKPQSFTISTINQVIKDIQLDSRTLKQKGNTITISMDSIEVLEATQKREDEVNVPNIFLYFDYVSAEYPREYAVSDDQLDFTFPQKGSDTPVKVSFMNFKSSSPIIFENRKNNEICIHSLKINKTGEIVTIIKPQKDSRYLLTSIDKILVPENVIIDTQSNLRSSDNSADYLIIAYPDFVPLMKPLAELRISQGFSPMIINVDDIYDEFNYGVESPYAIKYFLYYALKNWGKYKPEYVLLVGDATSDYWGDYRNSVINYVPTYSMATDQFSTDKWASDYWFSTVIGSDYLGDLAVGRISESNKTDVENAVNKIIYYEKKSPLDLWRASFGYISDDEGFSKDCEEVKYEFTPQYFINNDVYQANYPYIDNFLLPKDLVERKKSKLSPSTTYHIQELFNKGVVFLTYYGHGSPNIWSTERVWFGGDSKNSDNIRLTNLNSLPFIITMTCSTGDIDFPTQPWNICISEDMMRVKNGGSVAMLVPSGPHFTSNHRKMSDYLGKSIFDRNFRRFGDLILYAKLKYILNEPNKDLPNMLLFLGDPAQNFLLPKELIPLTASTEVVAAGKSAAVTVTGKLNLIDSGEAEVVIEDPDDKIVKSEKLKTNNYSFTYNALFPADAKSGVWKIRAYIKNEKTKFDAAGGVNINVDSPLAQLISFFSDFAVDKKFFEKDSITVTARINNPSKIAIKDLDYKITDVINNKEYTIKRGTISIQPDENVTVLANAKTLAAGVHTMRCRLLNYTAAQNGEHLYDTEQSITIPVVSKDSKDGKIDIALSRDAINLISSSPKNKSHQLAVDIFNIGSGTCGAFEVGVLDDKKQIIPSTIQKVEEFKSGEMRKVLINLVENVNEVNKQITIAADPKNAVKDENIKNNTITFSIQQLRYVDLRLTPDDITFKPEKPTEGHTVFIKVNINNAGTIDAYDVKVEGFLGNPDSAKKLMNASNNTSSVTIPAIAVGKSETAILRWDPIKNQGKNNIFVRASARESLPELNAANNVANKELTARTKAKFRTLELKAEQAPAKRDEIRLVATIQNIGETDAVGAVTIFYKSSKQEKSDVLGEVELNTLKAGEKQQAVLTLKLTKELLSQKIQPSVQTGLKSTQQLITNIDEQQQ